MKLNSVLTAPWCLQIQFSFLVKTEIHYTSFPVASPQQVSNKLMKSFFANRKPLVVVLVVALVRRWTRDRKVAGSAPGRGAIKSTRSTQPSIPPG